MADFFTALDAKTGDPKDVPISAVEGEYKRGNIKFAPGSRIPVRVDGVEGTIDASEYDTALQQGATPNFDPYGAGKAFATGVARSATLGLSDYGYEGAAWLGAKLTGRDPHQAVEDTRLNLRSLETDHPVADLAGNVVGIFTPSGVEGVAGKLIHGGEEVFRGSAEAARAVKETAEAEKAGQALTQAAQTEAATGKTLGSSLQKAAEYANPYSLVGKVADVATRPIEKLFGQNVGKIARYGTEGALIGAANEADEAELGDENLTGEALWTGIEHGAIFGSTLGMLSVGASKILSGASGISDRLAEAQLGGSAREYRNAINTWGKGGLGAFVNEQGLNNPFMTAQEKYEMAGAVAERTAGALDSVVGEADRSYRGAAVKDLRRELFSALDERAQKLDFAGNNVDKLTAQIKRDFDNHVGWSPLPPRPMEIPNGTAEKIYEESLKENGLPREDSVAPPKEVRHIDVNQAWREAAQAEGLGHLPEKPVARVSREEAANFHRELLNRLATSTSPEDKRLLGRVLANPTEVNQLAVAEVNKAVEARNLRRTEIRAAVKGQLEDRYVAQRKAYEDFLNQHDKLKKQAARKVVDMQAEADRNYNYLLRSANDSNNTKTASLASIREFRKPLDKLIPWGRSRDSLTNGAVEIKHLTRGILEGNVEKEFDRIAQKTDNSELLGNYLHAKAKYGLAKDALRMLDRERGAEGKRFGKFNRMGVGSHLLYAGLGTAAGHPLAGAAIGVGAALGRHYAAPVAAWALHKAGKLAAMKALRSEVELATIRSAKALYGGESTKFARLAIPNLPPHQLRLTAAEAMEKVYRLSDDKNLIAKLASVDPDVALFAPKSAQAMEGSARRAILYLMTRIPEKVKQSLATGRGVDPSDLNAADAQSFLESAAVVQDPRVATDAASRGQLTSAMGMTLKSVHPATNNLWNATIRRMETADKTNEKLLFGGRKNARDMLLGDHDSSLTLMLQQNANFLNTVASTQQTGKGMTHSDAGININKKAEALGNIYTTQSQAIETAGPGRRGKQANNSLGL